MVNKDQNSETLTIKDDGFRLDEMPHYKGGVKKNREIQQQRHEKSWRMQIPDL